MLLRVQAQRVMALVVQLWLSIVVTQCYTAANRRAWRVVTDLCSLAVLLKNVSLNGQNGEMSVATRYSP